PVTRRLRESERLLPQAAVVVGAGRIARNPRAVGSGEGTRVVCRREADDRSRARQQLPGVRAHRARPLEIVDSGVAPGLDPGKESVEARRLLGSGEPDPGEAGSPGFLPKDSGREQGIGSGSNHRGIESLLARTGKLAR